jgi:quercetin dioxygenase-like cupin family protein
MTGYSVARLDEIEEVDDGRTPFRPVRHHFGIRTFGVNAMTARAAGDQLINEHEETEPDSSEELYVVITGHATFELDGETRDAPAGTFVHVAPGVKRSASARDAGTTVVAIGGGPEGKPYTPSGWELFAPLFPLFESGEFEQGADRAEAILAENPSLGAAFYYNTACFESRAGRIDAAIAHLRTSVELAPSYTELARDDEDFASLRENPAFLRIIGS